ncbi:hypothetical protein ACN28I_07420 [Archangium gephyra]|uniref:hypothetical protein n=1 Tax=Archangium gephyra TaxID=48 RepID=UPI003B7608B5
MLAVASGVDGVELVRRLGADVAADGKQGDVERACRDFAPEGFDAALVLAKGDAAEPLLRMIRKGGRIAYPNGVEPAPKGPDGVQTTAYDGLPNSSSLKPIAPAHTARMSLSTSAADNLHPPIRGPVPAAHSSRGT